MSVVISTSTQHKAEILILTLRQIVFVFDIVCFRKAVTIILETLETICYKTMRGHRWKSFLFVTFHRKKNWKRDEFLVAFHKVFDSGNPNLVLFKSFTLAMLKLKCLLHKIYSWRHQKGLDFSVTFFVEPRWFYLLSFLKWHGISNSNCL